MITKAVMVNAIITASVSVLALTLISPKFIINFLDTDECLSDIHLCSHNCTNTIGSYTCSCDVGYQLNEDGFLCIGKYTAWL